jgi:hypothetical protein
MNDRFYLSPQKYFSSPDNSFDSLSTLTLFSDNSLSKSQKFIKNQPNTSNKKGDLLCNRTFGCLQNVGNKRFGFVRPNKLSEGVLFHFSDALPGSSPTSWNCVYPAELPCRLEFSLYKRSLRNASLLDETCPKSDKSDKSDRSKMSSNNSFADHSPIDANDYDTHPYSVTNVGPLRYSVGRILSANTLENLDSFQILTYRPQDLMNRVKPSPPLQPGQMVLFFLEEGENNELKATLITPCERASINHLVMDTQFPYGFVSTRFTDPLDTSTQSYISARLGPSIGVLKDLFQYKKPFFTTLQELKSSQRTTCWDSFIERQATFLLSSDGDTAELSWAIHNSSQLIKSTIKTDRDLPPSLLRRAAIDKLIIRYFFLVHSVLPVGALCSVTLNDEGKLILVGTDQIVNDPKNIFSPIVKSDGNPNQTPQTASSSQSVYKAVINWNKTELNLVSIQSLSKKTQLDDVSFGVEIAPGVRKGTLIENNVPVIIKILPKSLSTNSLSSIGNYQIRSFPKDPSIISIIEEKHDSSNNYIIYQLYSGTLVDLLGRPLKDRVQAIKSLFKCVSEMHKRSNAHGNLAPHAIYFNQNADNNEFEIVLGMNSMIAHGWNENNENENYYKDIYALGTMTSYLLSSGKTVPDENFEKCDKLSSCMCNIDKRFHLSNDLVMLLPGVNELISAMIDPIFQNRPSVASLLNSPLFWTDVGALKFIIKVFKLTKRVPEIKASISSFPPPWSTSCWHDLIPADEFPEMRQIAETYNGKDCYHLLMFLANLYGRSIDEQLLPEEARVIHFFPMLLSHVYHSFSSYRSSIENTLQEMDSLLNTILIFNHQMQQDLLHQSNSQL